MKTITQSAPYPYRGPHFEERAKSNNTETIVAGWRRALGKYASFFRATLMCAGFFAQTTHADSASNNDGRDSAMGSSVQSVNPVVQWNRTLLVIVRTHGAQPPTIHPTRSFAILHASIYDA